MVRGRVVRGQVEGKELGPRPNLSKLGDGDQTDQRPSTKDKEDAELAAQDPTKTSTSASAKTHGEEEVVLVLQPLPPECPKLGLDARMITLRPPSSTIAYEIGIWPTWSDTTYDSTSNVHDTEAYMDDERMDKGKGKGKEKEEGKSQEVRQKVVFANRYLIAETGADISTSL